MPSPAGETTRGRARYWVLTGVFLAAVITYLDRVCLSVAAPAMRAELGLSQQQFSYVFSIFNLAYAIFEVPAGWLGDRWGQRKTMVRILGGWSVFTIVTGMVRGYGSLLAARFAFGAAEAGAFPTLSRSLSRWFPVQERSRANGIMWTGARLGGALSPMLAVLLIEWLGWRWSFAAFGSLGLVWCAGWWRWYRDDPATHPAVSGTELAHIRVGAAPAPEHSERAPLGAIVTDRNLLALFWTYFASGFGFQFFVTWLPTYLMQEHGLTLKQSGFYAAVPLAAGAVGCAAGGAVADWLTRRLNSVKWGRRIVASLGFFLGAAGFVLALRARSATEAILWLGFAAATHDLSLPAVWATCTDVGGRFGGTASGFVNLASSLSAIAAPVAAAWLASSFGSFGLVLYVGAAVYVAGGLLWFLIDAGAKPVAV